MSSTLLLSFLSSTIVGLAGVFPLVIIKEETTQFLQSKEGAWKLNRLLSFAVGSLLSDVFLHLLPEAYTYTGSSSSQLCIGISVITGVVSFLVIEKLLIFAEIDDKTDKNANSKSEEVEKEPLHKLTESNGVTRRSATSNKSIDAVDAPKSKDIYTPSPEYIAEGYLNLLANFVDNLTHGLAVGGSFLVSPKVGLLTTFCILVHEIPHEISDFAILLAAGFDRWKAAKAQLMTASGAILGSLIAQVAGTGAHSSPIPLILAFTSGGFLYLALTSLTPRLLTERSRKESVIQVLFVLLGFSFMCLVSMYIE